MTVAGYRTQNPATGEILQSFATATNAQIEGAVAAADTAYREWRTRSARKDAVRIEIRRSIILGDTRPGDKFTEAQLADRLGVSRPTIREALNALVEEEGLVT